MKYSYLEFKKAIKNLKLDKYQLAELLSTIGHEAEVIGDNIDVTVSHNRKDCQKFQYLVFDLCGVTQELEQVEPPTGYSHSEAIPVSIEQVNKLLGSKLDSTAINQLARLGFMIVEGGVRPPDFRTDVKTTADVAEEVLRIVGFSSITLRELSKLEVKASPQYEKELAIKQRLTELGLFETRTYSFDATGELRLKNPFSEKTPYLRQSLLSGLLSTASKNPFMKRVNCFEIGNIFTPQEQTVLGILLTGQKNYDPLIERINKVLGVKLSFEAVGKSRLELLDVKQPNPITTQIPIDQVPDIKPTHKPINLPQFKPISKYPPLVRDVTLVEQELDVSAIRDLFPELLFVEEIDSYLNPTTKKKSVTYRFLFQKFENSFVSEEIKSIDQRIEQYLNNQR